MWKIVSSFGRVPSYACSLVTYPCRNTAPSIMCVLHISCCNSSFQTPERPLNRSIKRTNNSIARNIDANVNALAANHSEHMPDFPGTMDQAIIIAQAIGSVIPGSFVVAFFPNNQNYVPQRWEASSRIRHIDNAGVYAELTGFDG